MAGDDYNVNVHDPVNRYRAIFGVPSRKNILLGAACIFFVFTLIVIAFAIMSKQESPKRLPYALFQNTLDVSVDPCVDFYNFSCNLWEREQSNPLVWPRITTFSLLQDSINEKKKAIFVNAKPDKNFPRVVNSAINFYNRCVQQNTNASDSNLLLQFFYQNGGWPILNKSKWNESSFDLIQYSAFLIKNLDVHSIVGVHALDSDKNGGKNVIYLKVPTLLQDEDITLNEITYLQMVYVIIQSLNNSDLNSDIWDEIENLKITLINWKKLLTVPHKISDPIFMSVEELSLLIPEFNWLNYLQLITNDTLLKVNDTLTIHDIIAIDNLDYLKKVVSVINSDTFSKEELANLFGYFIVKHIWILIPGVLQNYASLNNYNSDDSMLAATNQCYDLALELFPCSLDYLYVKNLSHAGIQDGKVLISFLKLAFQDVIQKSWLDEKSKNSVLDRIINMKNIIGFPSYLNNKTEFDDIYKDFPETDVHSLSCYVKVLQFYIKMKFLQLKIETNQAKVILPRPVSDVSAYYIVHQHSLVYPISLHNPPFYYFEGPWYLNFGAIGSVIGHEMMHGIDCTGNQGNDLNVSWFSDPSRALYKTRASCFKDQYSVYDNSGMFKSNGTRTLRENIADTEGLHLAYEAYKKHEKSFGPDKKYQALNNYTPDQMFFIAFGSMWCSKIKSSVKEIYSQIHSLPDIRVNKALSNSESFALAFDCPRGSPMNPSKKCLIW